MNINGVEKDIVLDTGYSGFLLTPRRLAEELELQVEKLDEPKKYDTQAGNQFVEYVALDVTVEDYHKEMKGVSDITDYYKDLVVGMQFLLGSRIDFMENGEWELTFPVRS